MRVFASLVVIAAGSRTLTQHTIGNAADLAAEASNRLDELIDAKIEFSVVDELNVTGGCDDSDQQIINAAGSGKGSDKNSFPGVMNKCGREAYSFWSNSFDEGKFDKCVQKSSMKGISKACSKCMAIGPAYGAQNCKGPCMSNACSSGCKKCTEPSGPKIVSCAGFSTPEMKC